MLRNREFQNFVIIYSLLAIITVIIGFTINTASGILVMVATLTFGVLFFVFTMDRYKKIAQLSEQIDLVLHNADHLYIGESNEGELSILQSEITKMTLRIREQNDALKKEKEHLADSLADIAHQLRTPLTSVNLILSLLENNSDENDRKTLIREMKELFAKMDWLLTSLLKLSRIDAGIVRFQEEQIEVNTLINTALRPFLIPMELHNIDVQINVPREVYIQGDLGWLSESIQNILKNCMESTGNNGKIDIVCEDNPIFTLISIRDNGKGLNNEDLPHLFERFYRGKKENATGYGIGLHLSKMIITGQGGTIMAKNHSQGGAIFIIRFPK